MAAKTFEEFHKVAVIVDTECERSVPDTEQAIDAVRVARALMDWIYLNLNGAQQEQVAEVLGRVVGL